MTNDRRDFLKKATVAGLAVKANPNTLFSTGKKAVAEPLPTFNFESDLKIQKVESYTKGNATIVKVTADNGAEGFGQLAPYKNEITTTVLHEMVVPYALGQDPYKIDDVTNRGIELNYKHPWSFVCRATSGLETALWDLMAKREEKSVCEMLGGTPKPIEVYGSSMRRDIKPQEEAERMARLRDRDGFPAFKTRVGKVVGHNEDQWPGRSEAIIPAVRKAVGDQVVLQADANSCYTAAKAIEVGKLMEDNGYYFFEEPCPFWELEWTAEVNNTLKMSVAGGEQDNDLAQWKRMIAMNAVDIVQPDILYLGGVCRTMKVAAMAAEKEKLCVPHTANRSMLTVFAMHVLASIPNPAPHMEYSIESVEWVKGIFDNDLKVSNGSVAFPSEGPGWGIKVNDSWLNSADYHMSESK